MAFSFHESCPACKSTHEIFVREAQLPAANSTFLYECPKSRRTVLTSPRAYAGDAEVPDQDAIVAERHPKPHIV